MRGQETGSSTCRPSAGADAWVDLYWIPLGAGDSTHLVAASCRAYERLAARRAHRHPQAL